MISGHGRAAPGSDRRPDAARVPVDANVGRPQVAYRETITRPARAEGRFVRQSGGRGQYGHVWLEVEPLEPGGGFEFEDKIVGGSVPREYIPAVEAGIERRAETGVVAGYPVVDIKVTLVDGSYHEVDSTEMAFKIAGSMASRRRSRRRAPQVLEPVMKVEVTTPEEFLGDVVGDLNARRGADPGHGAARQRADDPGASCRWRRCSATPTDLRSVTQGRATYSMEFVALRSRSPTRRWRRASLAKARA